MRGIDNFNREKGRWKYLRDSKFFGAYNASRQKRFKKYCPQCKEAMCIVAKETELRHDKKGQPYLEIINGWMFWCIRCNRDQIIARIKERAQRTKGVTNETN